jgi:DNA (cytosine-5)-methyltransferase 1
MRFYDTCSGVGGFRMGMIEEGHSCIGTVEYDSKAIIAHKQLWEDTGHDWYGDIREVEGSSLPDFDVLTGGFPCFAFSIVGKREGFESKDPRATVFFEQMRIAKEKKPKYLFFENVKGLLSHDNGRSFARILSEMDKYGYDAEWQVINAQDFGYPVRRERVFIIGHKRGERTEKVFPITAGVRQDDSKTPIFQFRRGYFRVFEGYCPTLTASMGTGGNNVPMIIDNGSLRKLTPREVFRLQGVDDKYIDKLLDSGLPNSALYERAGRMVFIPIIREIAKRLK